MQAVLEGRAIHPEKGALLHRHDVGGAPGGIDQAHLADGVAGAEEGEDHFAAVDLLDEDLDRPFEQNVDHLARLLGGDHVGAGRHALLVHHFVQALQALERHAVKERDLAEQTSDR